VPKSVLGQNYLGTACIGHARWVGIWIDLFFLPITKKLSQESNTEDPSNDAHDFPGFMCAVVYHGGEFLVICTSFVGTCTNFLDISANFVDSSGRKSYFHILCDFLHSL